jgi:uncharacterized protein (TIGR03067 family)
MTYHPNTTTPIRYALVIDGTKRPATYDLSGIGTGAKFLGIWRLEGDTLTLCYNSFGLGRPTAFEGPGKGTFTEVYRRIKP